VAHLTEERSFYDFQFPVIKVSAFLSIVVLIWIGWKQPYGPQARAFFGELPSWLEPGHAQKSNTGVSRP
jgi:hypothetical protein